MDSKNVMPPPPPRQASLSLTTSIPVVAAPTTAVGKDETYSAAALTDEEQQQVSSTIMTTSHSKKRLSDRSGLPPLCPIPTKRSRRDSTGLCGAADKENSLNAQVQDYAQQGDEKEKDDLEYSGPLSDPNAEEGSSASMTTTALAEIDSMMKMGLQAFQDRERLQQENTFLKDDNAAKTSEIARLRAALKQKQEIITVRIPRVQISRVHEAPLPRATTTLF